MVDPHVESLTYAAGSGRDSISYENPEPLTVVNNLGRFHIQAGVLTVQPAAHYASEIEARDAIDPFLHAWEIDSDLLTNVGSIRFTFRYSSIIDRAPQPAGSTVASARGVAAFALAGMRLDVAILMARYPAPPAADFAATDDVRHAHERWIAVQEGRESLTAGAYFLLSHIQRMFGSRKGAATTLAIHKDVLSKLATLSSTRGSPQAARKAPKQGTAYLDLTPAEQQWLREVTGKIVRRLGEHAAGATLHQITLVDLPKI